MSDLLPLFDDDRDDGGDDRARDRSRSLWMLAVVLTFALAVTAIAALAFQLPDHNKHGHDLGGPTQVITEDDPSPTPTTSHSVTGPASTGASSAHSGTPSNRASSSRGPSTSPAKSSPSAPRTSASRRSTPPGNGPCGTPSPCAVPGQPGVAEDAVNYYRTTRGLGAVSGTETSLAQQCARQGEHSGGCVAGRPNVVVAEPAIDAARAVDTVTAGPHNIFADTGMTSFQVGWIYDPGTRLYYCAFIAA